MTRLLDTSGISRLSEPSVRAVVEPLVGAGRVGRAGITDLEVGYWGRNAREWDASMNDLDIFASVATTERHVHRARQVQRLLAARSPRGGKIPDLLIAAAAEEHDLVLLHYDTDFDLIKRVTRQRC